MVAPGDGVDRGTHSTRNRKRRKTRLLISIRMMSLVEGFGCNDLRGGRFACK